jgi:hypothetical protein
MPGLDPGIHSATPVGIRCRHGMDCRVKPGNDDKGEYGARKSSLKRP